VKSRLFWKTWGLLWIILMLTYGLSFVVSVQLESFDETRELRNRPWRAIESLALEAERVAEAGGDLGEWSRSAGTNRLGDVYLLDPQGREINGRTLPAPLRRGELRPFSRHAADQEPRGAQLPPGLARTVFVPGQEQPLTLIYLPRLGFTVWESIPIVPVLLIVGLGLTGCGAWLLSRHTVSPIRALYLASERVAQGDFSVRVANMLGSRQDELAELAQRFDEMTRKLGAASRFQKTLLRDVSHELRSPLTRLQVAAELLAEQAPQSSSPMAGRMEKEIGELESLIEEILALSRFDHAPDALNLECTDLVRLAEEVVSDANFTAQVLDRSVVLHTAQEKAACRVDAKLIRRALHNVIGNAVHYAPEDSDVAVSLSRQGADWLVQITDLGPGVPVSELEAIFRPFYRSSALADRSSAGMGIGLAMVARIVEAHGGSVSASNRPGGGLEVTITLRAGSHA
jgi:signal transduction histidine kinase